MTKSIAATSDKGETKSSASETQKPATKSITVSRQVFNDFACL